MLVNINMSKLIFVFVLFLIQNVLCDNLDNITFSKDDFKCSLPDVTSLDDNLDLTRFRYDFTKISEVKFPGVIGPLNETLICKIKCIDGNWVGPLCSSTPDGRFQPILRECAYKNNRPLLAISFKNSSIETDANFPHGSVVLIRCRGFGLYKLKGDPTMRCENGEWHPKPPECIPTTLITNFTADAPPSIKYTVTSGSGVVATSGSLSVAPESTIRLDCLTSMALGQPDWSWTQALTQQPAAWSEEEGEKETNFRLTLSKVSARHSGHYTCTSANGHTNTVHITVVNAICPAITASSPRLRQFSQGTRLGQTTHFSCQPGHQLDGQKLATCMPDSRWSSPPPRCIEITCPLLKSLDPRLSIVEYNSSFGGRAVFQCQWGHRLLGLPGIECEANGTWSHQPPICQPIYCPDPLIPENGKLITTPSSKNGKYPVGDLVTYSCMEGYLSSGESSVVCTETGFWSHPPPFCLKPEDFKKTDSIYVDNVTLVHFQE